MLVVFFYSTVGSLSYLGKRARHTFLGLSVRGVFLLKGE